MAEYSRRKLAWPIWVGMIGGLGLLWFVSPFVISRFYQATGYKSLTQALEILGDENTEPDFCVAGGIEHVQARELVEEAVAALEVARKFRPSEAQSWLLLGRGYCLLGQMAEAVAAYDRFTGLRPGNPLGWLELGFAYEALQKFNVARQAWKKAGLHPEQFIETGQEKQAEENLFLARKWYENARLLDPSFAEGWYWEGYTKEMQNDFLGALEAYKKAINLDETHLMAHFGIARIYKEANEIELALEAYQKIIQVDMTSIEAYLEIGQIEDQRGDVEKALEAYQAAAELGEAFQGNEREQVWKRAWPKYLLGNMYVRLERFSDAKLSYENAILSDPLNIYSEWSFWGLGRIANAENMYERALEYLNQALVLTPNYYLRSQVYLQMGMAYHGQGNKELFLMYLSKAHEEDLENKGLHLLYANSLIENGAIQQGIDEYKNYLTEWPNDLSVVEKLIELETLLKTQTDP
ncbi:MAG: tetratricopeptide repeat protein [Anaerolineales bacterium]|nr:tetratricopeptide repeat protein [Anaerolineales bacterium]